MNETASLLTTPWALALAIVLPALAWYAVRTRELRRLERLARFARRVAWPRLGIVPRTVRGPVLRIGAAAALFGIALAGPRWGVAPQTEVTRGVDYAIAVDASLSMLARDERGDRLTRAIQTVRRLRAAAPADRVALIAFAGRSYILTPLTNDDGALALYLENLTPDVVGQAGSSLARAIRQGTELLAASDGTSDRALLVLSDGEAFEPEDDVRTAAAEAAQQGVLVVTVGFGSSEGTTIPVDDGRGGETPKRDEVGAVVTTRYQPGMLAAAAEAANGVFVPADAPDRAGQIRSALARLQGEKRTIEGRAQGVPRFAWFLVPALLLLLWDTLARLRPAPRQPLRVGASALVALLLLTIGCEQSPDPADQLAAGDVDAALSTWRRDVARGDSSATTRYNLGTAYVAADSLDAGAAFLESVRQGTDGELRARARFNEGVARLAQGRNGGAGLALGASAQDSATARAQSLAAARSLYRAYLGERPGDLDAKWNYELALRDDPPQGGGGGGGGGNDDQQSPPPPGALDQRQADALLNSAAREEQDVQGKRQRMVRRPRPPGGKDW